MSKPQRSDPIPVRLPVDVLAEIESIAKTCDRTRTRVMVRALRLYLATEGADILCVKRGREQAAAGDVHDLDDVLIEMREIASGKAA